MIIYKPYLVRHQSLTSTEQFPLSFAVFHVLILQSC